MRFVLTDLSCINCLSVSHLIAAFKCLCLNQLLRRFSNFGFFKVTLVFHTPVILTPPIHLIPTGIHSSYLSIPTGTVLIY